MTTTTTDTCVCLCFLCVFCCDTLLIAAVARWAFVGLGLPSGRGPLYWAAWRCSVFIVDTGGCSCATGAMSGLGPASTRFVGVCVSVHVLSQRAALC
jgi:hypothetical protein